MRPSFAPLPSGASSLRFGAALLAALFGCAACAACASDPGAVVPTAGGDAAAPGTDGGAPDASGAPSFTVTVHGHTDLPRTGATQSLSATHYDAATNTLWALQDKTASVTPLAGSADFRTWTPGTPLPLTGRPGAAWDGEGLVRLPGALVAVTVETTPTVERFDPSTGAFLGAVEMPAIYTQQRSGNKGLESLTASPDGAFLFTANEQALAPDGPASTKSAGTRVRILRRELATGKETQAAYRSEPLGAGSGGDMGVSELSALSGSRLLVLERGFQEGYGNTVRIFLVDLAGAADVSLSPSLPADAPVLAKTLVVDLGALPSAGFAHPSAQPNPILDNYEALSIGPTLADGRRLLFVTSDDNGSASQVARVLVLAVSGL